MELHNTSAVNTPAPSVQQQLAHILARLESFPLERFARMEAELQQLKGMLEDESRDRRGLDEQLHELTLGLHDAIQKHLDRAVGACRQERDQHLGRLADRVESIEQREREERRVNVRLRIALLGAGAALVVSMLNALMRWFLPR